MVIAAAVMLMAQPVAVDLDRLLHCIAEVEQNKARSPGGIYGFTSAAWKEDTKVPFSQASITSVATTVAKRRLTRFTAKFKTLLYEPPEPAPYLLASAWRHGYDGALFRFQHHVFDEYANRVTNLYYDKEFKP